MSTAAPITALTVITDVDELTEVAETYARMADELAAMIEHTRLARTVVGRTITNRLGALHVELDELTTVAPSRARLVRLTNQAGDLADYADIHASKSRTLYALVAPLRELHAALVDQVAAHAWSVSA
jgi:hypothetical protein